MLLYYPFWMFMSFTIHFYIIFGTNLLTGGPARIAVFFAYFSVSKIKSKWNETFGSDLFGTNAIQETWSGRQEAAEVARRVAGAASKGGRAPCLVGPSWLHRPTSSSYIYLRTPKPSRSTMKT